MWRRVRGFVGSERMWIVLGTAAGAIVGASGATVVMRSNYATNTPAQWLAVLALIGFTPGLLVSISLWLALFVYWSVAPKSTAAIQSSESPQSRNIHVTLVHLAQLLILLPIPGLRVRFLPLWAPLVWLGLGFELASLVLAAWARRSLGRNWSGTIAAAADQRFVQSGPYRQLRHPIYSGLLGMYLATALISGEVHALAGLVLIAFAYWRKIGLEERHLRKEFGAAYEDYQKTTAALIPGIF